MREKVKVDKKVFGFEHIYHLDTPFNITASTQSLFDASILLAGQWSPQSVTGEPSEAT
jgi:hypothetical protein